MLLKLIKAILMLTGALGLVGIGQMLVIRWKKDNTGEVEKVVKTINWMIGEN